MAMTDPDSVSRMICEECGARNDPFSFVCDRWSDHLKWTDRRDA